MRKWTILAVLLCAGTAAAQESATTNTTTTTTKTTRSANGEVKTTTTYTGRVVRYEPGRTLVVEYPKQKTVTYQLGPDVVLGGDIRAGSDVELWVDPSEGTSPVVRKVTTVQLDRNGRVKKSTTTTTEVSRNAVGTVKAYVPGRTLTVTGNDGDITYYLNDSSVLPADIAVGRVIDVEPLVYSPGGTTTTVTSSPVVKRVTYHETTTTITKKKIKY